MANYTSPSAFIDISKKVEDEMKEIGQTIHEREANIQYLKARVNKLDEEIAEFNVALGNLSITNAVPSEDGETEDVVINNILQHKNSAAALFCQMKYKSGTSDHSLMKDVIGVVATLGATDDPRLSSMLSEFLGRETMLSLVCKTPQGVKALESYDTDGSINKSSGIRAFAAGVMGISLEDRFRVTCLDTLRSYPGRFIADDPHKRLDLVKPVLNEGPPSGFLGFAVNMIFIDNNNMYCMSKSGNTLRETLFYSLFSSLQVYRSREEMLKAQPFISNGAVSLDGGMIRANGVYVMGQKMRDVDIKFPTRSRGSFQAEDCYAIENRLKETTWKKRRCLEELQREQELLDHAKSTFELKKTEFVSVLASGSRYATPLGRVSTPR